MGYASLVGGYRGVTRTHKSIQCIGVDVRRTTVTDQQGNTVVVSETRVPIIARTTETVEEYVGLSKNTSGGDGPTITGHGGKKFQPRVEVSTAGTSPFVSYERTVDISKEGDTALYDVTVTTRESEIVNS